MRGRLISAGMAALIVLGAPVAQADGEPDGSFPSWEERVIHQWINRARCDPQVEMRTCGSACAEAACYAPTAPLPWTSALNRAARFHSSEMLLQGYFAHTSACTVVSDIASIYPATCDGSAGCACVGGTTGCAPTCTTAGSRVARFGSSFGGEIIAWTSAGPSEAFYLWLYEFTNDVTCDFTSENGHRWLILRASGAVGLGKDGSRYTGDFGGGPAPGRVPSGAHYPRQAATVEMWANWYDSSGPAAAAVNIGGSCYPMDLERGTAANGAWMAEVTGVATGCHRYYFEFQDSAGTVVTYPTTGSLAIGSGEGCPDWDATRPASCLVAGDQVFADGFELGNPSRWSSVVPSP